MPITAPSLAVQLQNLRFGWKQHPEVLNIPRLEIKAGERVFIHGASGSGKSTLLSLVSGVNLPREGSVDVLGQPIQDLGSSRRDRFRADHIGFIFQMFNLIPYLSVLENVTLPCRFSARRRANASANGGSLEAEAVRLLAHLDMASDTLLHRPVTQLSVGQQQRVATARALMGTPEIIIADEPTSALDSDMRVSFIELLFQECDATGATLLFVSHDRQMESLFERHIALDAVNVPQLAVS